MSVTDLLRKRNRKIVEHEDGTRYEIRRLIQVDFMSKKMLAIASPESGESLDSLFRKWMQLYPNDELGTMDLHVLQKGVTGILDGEAVVPIRITETDTGGEGEVYYMDLGSHRSWLVEQITDFSGLGREVPAQQDPFPGTVRDSALHDGEDVPQTPA